MISRANTAVVMKSGNDSTASTSGTSNVYGIHSIGRGTQNDSISEVRATTITTRLAGLGNKRSLIVNTNPNNFHCHPLCLN